MIPGVNATPAGIAGGPNRYFLPTGTPWDINIWYKDRNTPIKPGTAWKWHARYGHISLPYIQHLIRNGVEIGATDDEKKEILNTKTLCNCSACNITKNKRPDDFQKNDPKRLTNYNVLSIAILTSLAHVVNLMMVNSMQFILPA